MPWFALPTINTFTWWVIVESWCADNDYNMFLNFLLHPDLQKFCGIDLTELFPDLKPDDSQMVVTVWVCNAMGLLPLSYCLIQSGLFAKRIIMWNRKVDSNSFHLKLIIENLLFSDDYKVSLSKLKKIQFNGEHDVEIMVYVDDLRITAAS